MLYGKSFYLLPDPGGLLCLSQAVKNEPQLLSQLLDASVEGILAFDRDCRYTAWNRAMERISGLKRDDVLGKRAFDVFPFLEETGEDKYFHAALSGELTTSENRPYTVPETGRQGFFEACYSPLFDEHNEIVGGVGIVHDITEQKLAEESAAEAHRRLTSHVENSPLAVIEWDSDFRVSRWSESAARLFGWTADEVMGKHVSDWHFVFDEDADAVAQVTHRQRVGAESLGVLQNRNYTKAGDVLFCEWYNSVLRDDRGELVSVLSLVLDVTARKHAEEERIALLGREREARQHAEEADRLKDEFLATLSHELRTPLTSILGWATLLSSGEVEQENFKRAIETIERNARSQARLIDDLLDVSRIITGNLHLEVHPLNLAPVVVAAKDALRPAADAKAIKVNTTLDYENCLVTGDPNRLRQVVWNLLINAIKFTPRGGSVRVYLQCNDPAVRLTVTDTGEGISAEFLPFVFHRFRQEEGSISRKQGGLGLGLAVVRHLVELHGGTVSAESGGPGQGSTFVVDLPLAPERRKEKREGVDQEDLAEPLERRSAGVSVSLDGLRVMLVEDDDDSRSLLSLMLRRNGAEVTSASTSSEALSALDYSRPDVVISDIGMPDEDGYALLRRLRALPVERGGQTPAIALTGYATNKDRERALEAGYQLHLAKPVEPDELVAAIVSVVGSKR